MTLEIKKHDEAARLIADRAFQQRWAALAERCPWSTPFQSVGFAATWYGAYRPVYSPLLAIDADSDGRLNGLLCLARAKSNSEVVVAGGRQAEYPGWLAADGNIRFLGPALEEVTRSESIRRLTFRFLPAGSPSVTDQLRGSAWKVEETEHRRPLISVGDRAEVTEYVQQKLARRSTKNYLNRLKRLGDLRLERIVSSKDLAPIVDTLIAYYDTRQGAINDATPFHSDPLKKAFHLSLLDQSDSLHVTVMRAGQELVSALVGAGDGKVFSLGMPIFSPFLADYSPVMIHLLMLAEFLNSEGYQLLDLTPGTDSFKERFATSHDTVRLSTVYFDRADALRRQITVWTRQTAERTLRFARIDPQRAQQVANRLSRGGARGVLSAIAGKANQLIRRTHATAEIRVYAMPVAQARELKCGQVMVRDHLQDLLAFEPRAAWQTRRGFLSSALRKIENGEHAYTRVVDGVLAHYGWLIDEQSESTFPEVGQTVQLPKGTAVLYDFYTDPEFRGRGYYQESLKQLAHATAALPSTERVLISVLATNGPSRRAIEKTGFTYIGSLMQDTRSGKVTRSSSLKFDQ